MGTFPPAVEMRTRTPARGESCILPLGCSSCTSSIISSVSIPHRPHRQYQCPQAHSLNTLNNIADPRCPCFAPGTFLSNGKVLAESKGLGRSSNKDNSKTKQNPPNSKKQNTPQNQKQQKHVEHNFPAAVASYILRTETSDSLRYSPLGFTNQKKFCFHLWPCRVFEGTETAGKEAEQSEGGRRC